MKSSSRWEGGRGGVALEQLPLVTGSSKTHKSATWVSCAKRFCVVEKIRSGQGRLGSFLRSLYSKLDSGVTALDLKYPSHRRVQTF